MHKLHWIPNLISGIIVITLTQHCVIVRFRPKQLKVVAEKNGRKPRFHCRHFNERGEHLRELKATKSRSTLWMTDRTGQKTTCGPHTPWPGCCLGDVQIRHKYTAQELRWSWTSHILESYDWRSDVLQITIQTVVPPSKMPAHCEEICWRLGSPLQPHCWPGRSICFTVVSERHHRKQSMCTITVCHLSKINTKLPPVASMAGNGMVEQGRLCSSQKNGQILFQTET